MLDTDSDGVVSLDDWMTCCMEDQVRTEQVFLFEAQKSHFIQKNQYLKIWIFKGLRGSPEIFFFQKLFQTINHI